MNILILGGTGVMGRMLVELLESKNTITVTSRSRRSSDNGNVRYVEGNAKELGFLKTVLSGGMMP